MRRHYNFICLVPDIQPGFGDRMDAYPVYPCDIIIGRLDAVPVTMLQHFNGHSHQCLSGHFRRKIILYTHITYGEIDNAVHLSFQSRTVRNQLQAVLYFISLLFQPR